VIDELARETSRKTMNKIVRFDREQMERGFRDLLGGTKHYPVRDNALKQNSISAANHKRFAPCPVRNSNILFLCTLYVLQLKAVPSEAEVDINFEGSVI